MSPLAPPSNTLSGHLIGLFSANESVQEVSPAGRSSRMRATIVSLSYQSAAREPITAERVHLIAGLECLGALFNQWTKVAPDLLRKKIRCPDEQTAT